MAKDAQLNEPLIDFFKGSNIKAIQRVLERAQQRAEADAKKRSRATKLSSRTSRLTRAMNTAMSAYGRMAKGGPSIRQTAPDTGGRPYHFGYSTITKGTTTRGGGTRKETPAAKGASAAAPMANTRESAHQIYTEREGAVDHQAEPIGPDAPRIAEAGLKRQAGTAPPGIDTVREWVAAETAGMGLSLEASEASAQAYIEDPAKVSPLLGTKASFGTIGDTLQDRLAFWDLVHAHESGKGGRTQTRMVLELPHEATAEQRHEIVRNFTNDLRRKGIPFWASIHVPTKDNDSRNHHAHVVCTDRPMRKMVNPETGNLEWDFSIAAAYKRANRANAVRYPYRQNRDPEMRDRGYVKQARHRLAEVVNDVMSRSATGVKYDARSYRDMGLDVAPMKNVSRILADKLGKQSFVVMDAAWTRKMIDTEMHAAAAQRDTTFIKLQQAEHDILDAARHAQRSAKANARLPQHLRVSPMRLVGNSIAQAAMEKVLQVRRDRLATAFVDQSTEAALKHIATATAPAKAGMRPHTLSTAPDQADLADLHAAALEELAVHRRQSQGRRAGFHSREAFAAAAWHGPNTAEPVRPAPPPSTTTDMYDPSSRSHPAEPYRATWADPPMVIRLPDQTPPPQIQPEAPRPQPPQPVQAQPFTLPWLGPQPPALRTRSFVNDVGAMMDGFVHAATSTGLTGREFAENLRNMMADMRGEPRPDHSLTAAPVESRDPPTPPVREPSPVREASPVRPTAERPVPHTEAGTPARPAPVPAAPARSPVTPATGPLATRGGRPTAVEPARADTRPLLSTAPGTRPRTAAEAAASGPSKPLADSRPLLDNAPGTRPRTAAEAAASGPSSPKDDAPQLVNRIMAAAPAAAAVITPPLASPKQPSASRPKPTPSPVTTAPLPAPTPVRPTAAAAVRPATVVTATGRQATLPFTGLADAPTEQRHQTTAPKPPTGVIPPAPGKTTPLPSLSDRDALEQPQNDDERAAAAAARKKRRWALLAARRNKGLGL